MTSKMSVTGSGVFRLAVLMTALVLGGWAATITPEASAQTETSLYAAIYSSYGHDTALSAYNSSTTLTSDTYYAYIYAYYGYIYNLYGYYYDINFHLDGHIYGGYAAYFAYSDYQVTLRNVSYVSYFYNYYGSYYGYYAYLGY